jgi:hypothetical protein
MRNSNAIKNLSIAAEGLARISEYEAQRLRERIYTILERLIKEDETLPEPKPQPDRDEEIPF